MGFFAKVDESLGLSSGVTSISNALADLNHDVNRELASLDSSLGISDTVTALTKNPLPTLATYALVAVGVPQPIAGAMVNMANGGSFEQGIMSMATSYIGEYVGEAAGKSFKGSQFEAGLKGVDPALAKVVAQAVTSASGSAAVAALTGKSSLSDIFAAAANGAVTSFVTQKLTAQLGFTDPKNLDTKLVTNAISSATNAILKGQDIAKAVTSSVTQTALTETIKTNVDKIVKNSATLSGLKADTEKAIITAKNYFANAEGALKSTVYPQSRITQLRSTIDSKLAQDKLYREQYAEAVSRKDIEAANTLAKKINANASSLPSDIKAYNDYLPTYETKIKPYVDAVNTYTDAVQAVNDLNAKVATINGEQSSLVDTVVKDAATFEGNAAVNANLLANQIGEEALAEAKKVAINDPIAAAYKEALGRDASASEISSWAEQVASKGIDSVVSSINNTPEAVTRRETTEAKEAYSSITGSQPTAAEMADFKKSGDVVAAAQDAAINGLDLPDDYKFPDQASKVSFGTAFADARKRLGPNATFEWTNPETGKTGKFTTKNEAEAVKPFDATSMSRSGLGAGAKAALDAGKTTFTWADGKVYKVPDAYAFMLGSSQSNAETQRLLAAGVVPAKSTDKANDYFGNEFATDPMTGAIVSGDGWAAGTSGKTFDAINTAAGGALVKALDVGSGVVKGGSNIVGQVGTLAGLTGLVDMDNLAVRTSKQVNDAVDKMRSADFKNDQELMNKAIAAAGNAGVFAQAVEAAKQFGVNPTQLAEFVVQNGMSLLVGSGAMTVARGLGAGMTVAEAASLGANALTQGASVAQDTYGQAIKDGVTPEEALNRARAAGAIGGVVSAVANKFIPGALSNEARLAQTAIVKDSLAKALKGELATEIVEEDLGKIASNIINKKPWNEDLGATTVQSILGSGLVTSLVHVSTGGADPIASTPETGLEGVTPEQFKATTELLSKSGQVPTAAQVTDAVKTTQEEAAQFYQEAFGAPPTQEQLQAFIGKPEAEVQQVIDVDQTALSKESETAYRVEAANQTDLAEAARLAGDGAGQAAAENAAATAKAKADQIKALVTAHPEMAAAKTPSEVTADKILAMTSGAAPDLRYDLDKDGKITVKDAVLGSSGTEVRTDVRADGTTAYATPKDIQDAIAGIEFPAGITPADVTQAITNYMSKNPSITLQQVADAITSGTSGLATDAGVKTSISNALKGVATTADVNAAIAGIKFPAGLTKADVAAEIKAAMKANPGLSPADVTKSITDYMTANPGLTAADVSTAIANATKGMVTSAELAQTEKDILAEVALNEKAGMTRDAALQKAINTVATTQKTDTASLLTKLGKTEENLKTQFSTQITSLDTKLSTAIADAKAAGLKGDEALQSAIDKVAADQQTTAEEILTQMGKSTAELKTQFASDISGLSAEMQTKYDALSQAQKDAVDAQAQQGKDLTLAITESAAGLQSQISGLSAEMQTQYGALTQAQKDAVDAQVQQGKDLTKAITDTASGLQSQITGLGADAQAKYAALTAAQKLEVDARVQQGVDLTSAINAAQTKTETQIGTLSADLQTKYDALTKADQDIVNAQIQQGIDTKTAIDNATKTTTEQITKVQTDLTKNITDVQTQFNTRVDELVSQGKSYQDATQAALGELNTGVLGLQTSVTDIKAAQAAEIARVAAEKEAAAKAGRAKTAQQGRQALLAAGAAQFEQTGSSAVEPERPMLQTGLTSTGGDTKFESVLGSFLKDAEAGFYDPKQLNEQQQQAAPAKKELDMQNPQGTNYFNYGSEYDINEVLAENPGTEMLYSKAGGLATPLFAGGGQSRKQNYAGGGLNVIHHEGKPRIDFRTGNAVTGPGDGQSDDIPAMLADGEFVFPADVVAALGNGSTKAGSDKLYDMMHSIRAYHRSAKPKDLPPPAKKSPLDYLKKTA